MTDTIFKYKEPENPQTIGELVRALRVKCGMTQGELAQMARITVNSAALLEASKVSIGELTRSSVSVCVDGVKWVTMPRVGIRSGIGSFETIPLDGCCPECGQPIEVIERHFGRERRGGDE